MRNEIEKYYDDRSMYALYPYAEDWNQVIERFGQGLHHLIAGIFADRKSSDIHFYDCTCGIGTQAIALAQKGYPVTASDLSGGMLDHARRMTNDRGLQVEYFQQDLRLPMPERLNAYFDVVSSINNSLIFISNQDNSDHHLVSAFENMKAVAKPGGALIISLRPYDEYWEKKVVTPPGRQSEFLKKGDKYVRFTQKYEWLDENFYECTTQYEIKPDLAFEQVETVKEKVRVRAWRKKEIIGALTKAGWAKIDSFIYAEPGTHYRERYFTARKRV